MYYQNAQNELDIVNLCCYCAQNDTWKRLEIKH